MRLRESSERKSYRVVCATRLDKAEKKEPRTHDQARPYDRVSRRAELASALQEWADDYEGTHSIFED